MRRAAAFRKHLCRQDGQALVLVALAMIVLVGCAALVIDIGRVWIAQRKLQGAVDAAALVAGQNLPNASQAYTSAVAYSGAAGDKNQITGYGITPAAPTITFECVSHGLDYTAGSPPTCPTDTSSTDCQPTGAQAPTPSGVTTCNAVRITETATVKTTLGSIFFPSFTVKASATAAAGGGAAKPLNVYVILDNTKSMTDPCSATVTGISGTPEKLDCAKAGMRAFLQAMWPCDSQVSCGTATANGSGQLGANVANPDDKVGLIVIPAITGNPPGTSTLDEEIDCNSSDTFADTYPTYTPYTYNSGQPDGGIPASDDYSGYLAVGLSSDYRPSGGTSNTTLNATSSNIVEAVDWGQCPGGLYPGGNYYGLKDIGGQGSYLAGAITEAQHDLNQNGRPGAQNAIVVESDGQLNNPKTFTDDNPCQSAVNAADQAKAAGTLIYAIAYGSNGTVCPDTGDSLTDLETMEDIATSAAYPYFYDEPTTGDLTSDFEQAAASLTQSRLIPDCTQAPPNC